MNTCERESTNTHTTTNTETRATAHYAKPRYHVKEGAQGYDLRVYVPGADKSGVTLSLDKGLLSVVATRSAQKSEGWRLVRQELPSDDYRLLLQVDNKIATERIAARLKNGVLEVTLPFIETAITRVIEVD